MLSSISRVFCNPALWIAFIAMALIGLGAEPAHAAVTMQDFIAPFTELHGGFLTFIQLGCAAAALIALAFVSRAPGASLLALVIIIVVYIIAVAVLA